MRDKYTLIITKTSRVMLKIDMLCRMQELFGKCKNQKWTELYASVLQYFTSNILGKVYVLLPNIYIYLSRVSMMTTLYLYMWWKIDGKIKINNRNILLILIATMKIVSCLKNYCYHDHDNRHVVKSLCLPQSLYQNFWLSLNINCSWSFLIFEWIHYKFTSTQIKFDQKLWNLSQIL